MSKPKNETICKVEGARPFWYYDSTNYGRCRKYQPHLIEQQSLVVMQCADTKLPCPINGEHQVPMPDIKAPKWMAAEGGLPTFDTDGNGKRIAKVKPVRSGSKYD